VDHLEVDHQEVDQEAVFRLDGVLPEEEVMHSFSYIQDQEVAEVPQEVVGLPEEGEAVLDQKAVLKLLSSLIVMQESLLPVGRKICWLQ
jgi:hypothetical protein